MRSRRTILKVFIGITVLLSLALLAGCSPSTPAPAAEPAAPVDAPASPTADDLPVYQPPEPTPTEPNVPMAARVNGEGIWLSEYEAELQRYAAAVETIGEELDPVAQNEAVLNELVDQYLLAQAAFATGFRLDDAALDARIAALGDPQAVAAWKSEHGYDDASFRMALRRQAAAAWQRDAIAGAVPESIEQVQARQILVFDAAVADRLHKRLVDGADFATLARQIDPTGGELGWFPRGYLTQPEVEAAAFNLQPGQYSEVIETSFGYHIIQTIARDGAHPVSADVRRFLQHQALRSWIEEQRSRSQIEVLLP